MPEARKPPGGSRLRSAMSFLEGGEDTTKADGEELPGWFGFVRENWNTSVPGSAESSEGPLARLKRLNQAFAGAKEKQAENLQTYEAIADAARLSKEYLALLLSACFIATFGLLQGSSAAVVGAMLIAPLMMPILGFALGATWGDRRLLVRSVAVLGVSTLSVLTLSATMAAVIPVPELSGEVMRRTNPDLYDILVALASGLIGAYGFANPKISPSISGVAIAVALMPPLCTVGIGIGQWELGVAGGAFLLYASNLVGIALAACFAFWRLRVHPVAASGSEVGARAGRNVVLAGAALLLIALPLGYFMVRTYQQKSLVTAVRDSLTEAAPDAEIVSLRVDEATDTVRSVVIVPDAEAEAHLQAAEDRIRELLGDEGHVTLLVLRTHEARELGPSAPPAAE